MIHGFASESADVFDLEALDLLSSFAERNGSARDGGPVEVFAAPMTVISAPRPSPANDSPVRMARLAAFAALFFVFGAIGPWIQALRGSRAVETAAARAPIAAATALR